MDSYRLFSELMNRETKHAFRDPLWGYQSVSGSPLVIPKCFGAPAGNTKVFRDPLWGYQSFGTPSGDTKVSNGVLKPLLGSKHQLWCPKGSPHISKGAPIYLPYILLLISEFCKAWGR